MFTIFKTKNKEEIKEVIDTLNKQAKDIFDAELVRVMSELENDLQKVIYLDWWYGGGLWEWNEEKNDHIRAKRYRHVSEHDWNMAYGYIMDTVSRGMG